MKRLLALSTLLAITACSGTTTSPTRPELAAFNAECYEGVAGPASGGPDMTSLGTYPRICAFQDGLYAEVHDDTAMGRLSVECDQTKVRVEMRRRDTEEFREVACNDDYPAELICNWTTTFRITGRDFGHGTTDVLIRSDCPITDYAGVQCDDSIPPYANFGSTRGDCTVGDTFVIDGIAAGDELEAWADPID